MVPTTAMDADSAEPPTMRWSRYGSGRIELRAGRGTGMNDRGPAGWQVAPLTETELFGGTHGFSRIRIRGSGRVSRHLGPRFPILAMYGSYLAIGDKH
jgi:hypothetical protein